MTHRMRLSHRLVYISPESICLRINFLVHYNLIQRKFQGLVFINLQTIYVFKFMIDWRSQMILYTSGMYWYTMFAVNFVLIISEHDKMNLIHKTSRVIEIPLP